MKFLADMGVSPLTVKRLKEEGYDAVHLSEEGLISSRLFTVISECAENFNNGAIIIVEDYRYRVRNLPLN